jgi:hypothetical protein
MKGRSAQHEVGRRLAQLRAVHHHSEMDGLDMAASHLEAHVHRRFEALRVAALTLLDTTLHTRIQWGG